MVFLVYVHPAVFAGSSPKNKMMTVLQSALMYSFFPLISVFLLKAVGFINSVFLATQKDRIIPFIMCNIWYFWIWFVWRGLDESPKEIVLLAMAIFLASAIGLMANIYMKISMHAIAMGVMTGFVLFLILKYPVNAGVYMSAALFITGLVCTSRFIASDHTAKEIYGGLLAGFASTLLVAFFVSIG
jgi:hypothetical protein